ncbi:MAG: LURP-one-related family protein [Verrucomicrobiota bacterium]|nr:LURP-one-related family protein [Verrucomicrobiota bacterium]
MRYVMKEKWLAWGDDFAIFNEAGQQVYFVDGRAFSIGKKLSFQDMNGNELAFIRQRLLAWGPTYELLRDGREMATIRKHLFTLFKAKFTVDLPGPNDLEAVGSFWEHNYSFSLNGKVAARISKEWIALTDSYGIDIQEGIDPILILSCVVIIDMICHEEKNG